MWAHTPRVRPPITSPPYSHFVLNGQPDQQHEHHEVAPMDTDPKPSRRDHAPIKVYCLPDEKRQIEANAGAAGVSLSNYLLSVGLGYQVTGIVDHKQVEELVRINGDLGRLGGLLKLWLTDDAKTAEIGKSTIRAVLAQIELNQKRMMDVVATVVTPKSNYSLSAAKAPEITL